MTDEELSVLRTQTAAVSGEPEYGFVHRDLDVQAIERHLLLSQDSNELLVRGMAGVGKSAVLAHLAGRWRQAGLVKQVFWFSYADRAWTRDQIARNVRRRLFTPAEHAGADAMPELAQAEEVVEHLRSSRHLIVLDQAEIITAARSTTPHALSGDEQEELRLLLSQLRGGRTLVLLGSRETEAWLDCGSSGPDVYSLPGLEPQSTSALAERVLAGYGAGRQVDDDTERKALQDVLTLLDGNPLQLTAILPLVRATSKPSVVLAGLQAGSPDVDPSGLISRTIEGSYRKLDPVAQNSLMLLAPFTAVIHGAKALELYQNILLQDSAVRDIGPLDLPASLARAISVGLASPHPQYPDLVQLQPALPYFLRWRLQGKKELQAAADQAHYQLHRVISSEFGRALSQGNNPQLRDLVLIATKASYFNLTAALSYALNAGQPIAELIRVLDLYLEAVQQSKTRRELLDHVIDTYPNPDSEEQKKELAQLHYVAGMVAVEQHRARDAAAHLATELRLRQAVGDSEGMALTYHHQGKLAQEEGRYKAAEVSFRQALDIHLEQGNDRAAGIALQELGVLALKQKHDEQAETFFRQALEIYLRVGDEQKTASVYGDLGRLAGLQGQVDQAMEYLGLALQIFQKFGDQRNAAAARSLIGYLAMGHQQYQEAEANARQALDGYLQADDRYAMSETLTALGLLAHEQGRYDEAKAYYNKGLEIAREFGDHPHIASANDHLGKLAEDQKRYEEAEAHYRQALSVRQSYAGTFPESGTASRLGFVLASLGRHAEATAALLDAATAWRRDTGHWPEEFLLALHRERSFVELSKFTTLLTEKIPAELISEFDAVINVFPKGAAGPVTPLRDYLRSDSPENLGDTGSALFSASHPAETHEIDDRFDEAMALYQRIAAEHEQILGDHNPDVLGARDKLIHDYESTGRLEQAIPLLERTLADHERILGENHPDTFADRSNLGAAYVTSGRLDEAIPLLERVHAEHERILGDSDHTRGDDQPDILSSSSHLGVAYLASARLDEAIPLLERTLADHERILAHDDPDTLTARITLAAAYLASRRVAEAIPLLEHNLAEAERILGDNHPDAMTARTYLAMAYQAGERPDEAIALYERVLADHERIIGRDHPDTLNIRDNLAAVRRSAAQRQQTSEQEPQG